MCLVVGMRMGKEERRVMAYGILDNWQGRGYVYIGCIRSLAFGYRGVWDLELALRFCKSTFTHSLPCPQVFPSPPPSLNAQQSANDRNQLLSPPKPTLPYPTRKVVMRGERMGWG